MRVLRVVFTCVILAVLIGTALPGLAQEQPYFPTAGWRTSSPEAQGLDSAMLENYLGPLSTMPGAFHSVVLIRHGTVVLDASLAPFSSSRPQAFRDSAEAVLATLIGMAIDRGLIRGVDQSIWDFLPKDQTANMDANKAALTIEDFLTHRTGLTAQGDPDFQKYYPLNGNDEAWTQVILDSKMGFAPGTDPLTWRYGDGQVLSAIFQKATGMTALDFARKNLFGPLGISDVTWLADPQGVTIGFDEIYLSPQDMAKIVYLYLHNGQWEGQQIVSERWAQAAIRKIAVWMPEDHLDAFGYGWIVSGEGRGRFFGQMTPGGEFFGVFPELDLIYMITGDTFNKLLGNFPDNLLQTVGDQAALPENPEALAALKAKVQSFANAVPRDVASLPTAFRAISGKTYTLADNPAGWQTLAVDFGAPGATEGTLTLGIGDRTIQLKTGLDFVDRITPVGLPAQPASAAYRLLGDQPWISRTNWTEKELRVWIGDLMGRELWVITLRPRADNKVGIQALLNGLGGMSNMWSFVGAAD